MKVLLGPGYGGGGVSRNRLFDALRRVPAVANLTWPQPPLQVGACGQLFAQHSPPRREGERESVGRSSLSDSL